MKFDRKIVITIFVTLLIGFWLGGGTWQKGPFSPIPLPTPGQPNDRPILALLKRAARAMLWLTVIAEPPPSGIQPDHRLVHSPPPVGDDGYPIVDHSRGW